MDKQQNMALKMRHRGRMHQVPIFLGKMFRSFIYMSDWKMIPMAAVIAAMVSMVVRKDYFLTMEGTLKGSFAMTCVAIWNGCFNSIQVICRERSIIKREHRSGMHVTAYVFSHMVYQALLCLAQTVTTLYVCHVCGVQFPAKGVMSPWFMLDLTVTIFLISYASDMVSLLVSAIAHTTTAAMTVMPFVLIFQLVFSGGIFTLPSWATHISDYTISNYGLKCLSAQADYNNQPMVTGWSTLTKVENKEIPVSFTIGKVADILSTDNGLTTQLRATEIDLAEIVTDVAAGEGVTIPGTLRTLLEQIMPTTKFTVGQLIDTLTQSDLMAQYRDTEISFTFKLKDVIDAVGRDEVKNAIQTQTAATMYNASYVCDRETIQRYWLILGAFVLLFAGATIVVLEFIDKDKR